MSKVKESSFFLNRTSLTPRQIFDAYLSENTNLSPSRFNFSVGFISRSFFETRLSRSDCQMVLKLIRTNEIEDKKRFLFTPTNL